MVYNNRTTLPLVLAQLLIQFQNFNKLQMNENNEFASSTVLNQTMLDGNGDGSDGPSIERKQSAIK